MKANQLAGKGSPDVCNPNGRAFAAQSNAARQRNRSVYEGMIAKYPKDVGAYEGLGDAELEQGHYNAARAAFLQASFHDPADVSIRLHLQMLNTVVGGVD